MTEAPLQPLRDPRATLADLVEVLLNKGVLLHVDLLISVADIPLIGVNVRAALAGIETMLEYGMMQRWDAETRAWIERSRRRHLPLEAGEELRLSMIGSYRAPGRPWRPGMVILTDSRLLVFRREPRELIWQSSLAAIHSISLFAEAAFGDREVDRIRLVERDGGTHELTASRPAVLVEEVRTVAGAGVAVNAGITDGPRISGRLWYLEPRFGGAVWRGGEGQIDNRNRFSWQSPTDARPAVSFDLSEIARVDWSDIQSPIGRGALSVQLRDHAVTLAARSPDAWIDAMQAEG